MNRLFRHPEDEALTRLAIEPTARDDDPAIERHLGECARCRAVAQDVRVWHDSLRVAKAPAASEAMLARIVARREAGERVMLADAAMAAPRVESGRFGTRWAVMSAIAAVALVWVTWARRSAPEPRAAVSSEAPKPVAPPNSDAAPPMFSPWPSVAYAENAPKDTEPLYRPIAVLGTSLLKAGARTYVRSSASSYRDYMPIGATTIDVREVTREKESVWRVVKTEPLAASSGSFDTAWVRQTDLKLLYRRYHYAGSTLTQSTVGDTLLVQTFEMQVPKGYKGKVPPSYLKGSILKRLTPGRIFVNDLVGFWLLVRSQALSNSWQGSIDVNTSKIGPGVYETPRSVNVSVQGDSVVNTLWGYVPCWRVVVHTGMTPERWYVSKQDREVLLVTGPNGMNWPRSRLDLMGRFLK